MIRTESFRDSKATTPMRARGFSLIEVMLAVVVLSVGLLALAALQGALIRNSASAKARSVGVSLAEEKLEAMRTFVTTAAYDNVGAGSTSDTVQPDGASGTTYTRTVTVTRYAKAQNDVLYASVGTTGTSTYYSDFKLVNVDVSWAGPTGQEDVQVTDVVGAEQPGDSGRLIANNTVTHRSPVVRIFTPTETGVIPIATGDSNNDQATASSNPKPVQESSQAGATITRFNVQTYTNESGNNPLLERRLEFIAAACKCTTTNQQSNDAAGRTAYEPTFWSGTAYTEPRAIDGKPYATARDFINNQQDTDQFDVTCNTCCRDHHDAPSTATDTNGNTVGGSVWMRTDADVASDTPPPYKYDPWRPKADYAGASGSGDHNHYDRTDDASVPALANDLVLPGFSSAMAMNSSGSQFSTGNVSYLETCRIVRVNGTNRVTVDTRLENLSTIRTSPTSRNTSDSSNVTLNATDVANYQNFARSYILKAVGNSTVNTDTTITLPTGYPNTAADSDRVNTSMLTDQLYQSDGVTQTSLATSYDAPNDASGTSTVNLLNLENSRKQTVSTLNDYYNVHMRAIYIDFISKEAQKAVACIGNATDRTCATYATKAVLDIIPIFAVNLSNLTEWHKPIKSSLSIPCDDTTWPGYPNTPSGSCATTDVTLFSMNNGFPQTYGASFTRGVTQAKANGADFVDGFSYRGNSGLTDQVAIDPNDANQFNAGVTTSHQDERKDDAEVLISGTGSVANQAALPTTYTVKLSCQKKQGGNFTDCGNNEFFNSNLQNVVVTFQSSSPSGGSDPAPNTSINNLSSGTPAVCSKSSSDFSLRTCDFGTSTSLGAVAISVSSYNRCVQSTSTSGSGQNRVTTGDAACVTSGQSARAEYKLCGATAGPTPSPTLSATATTAASSSPSYYFFFPSGTTYVSPETTGNSWDISKAVSWITFTTSNGFDLSCGDNATGSCVSTGPGLPSYAKSTSFTGGQNGVISLVFLACLNDGNGTAPCNDACPTVTTSF